jgi:hypothetical protein
MNIHEIKIPEKVPEGSKGIAKVEYYDISKEDSRFTAMRAMQHGGSEYVREGKYARLMIRGVLMMSDTQMERDTNLEFVRHARGDVLIAGLGLGLILFAIADNPDVRHVTVIEKYQEVVDLVAPSVKEALGDRLTIIVSDIHDWKPERGALYDTIYFDIWASQSTDTLKEMATLHRRFGGRRAPGGWVDSWRRGMLQARKRREARQPRGLGFGWGRP